MKRIFVALLFVLAATTAFADEADLSKVAVADNSFAFDLLKQIEKGQPGQNIFISPYSVSTVLQILSNGAAGKTKAEIQDVLRTKDISPNDLNEECRGLNQSLLSQSNVTLDLANSIWVNRGFDLKPGFVSTNEDFFQAELAAVDFRTPESADTINGWAAKQTHGKINDIVSFPFPANTEVVLANAIYFKGKWAEPFDKSLTQPRYFYLAAGIIKQAPMMSQHKRFGYQEGDGFQAVELPYAGNRLQMVLVLPATNSSPEKLLADFTGAGWNNKILPQFIERDGTVIFPKFKLSYDIVLNEPLEDLGMTQAFIPGSANFSAMAADPLFVSEVKQKSFVDVDEEGTEAAAVTTVTMRDSVVMRSLPPFEMIVNRPFLFMITDNPTRTILFMGIVDDPTL